MKSGNRLVCAIAAVCLVGCYGGGYCKDSCDVRGDDVTTPLTAASHHWGEDEFTLEYSGESGMFFGMAETGSSCAESGDCWTGEDCHGGYELESGDLIMYCHFFEGGSLTLRYGGEPSRLDEGSETVFAGPESPEGIPYEGSVTYYLEDRAGECWVWGDRPSYYPGCTEL